MIGADVAVSEGFSPAPLTAGPQPEPDPPGPPDVLCRKLISLLTSAVDLVWIWAVVRPEFCSFPISRAVSLASSVTSALTNDGLLVAYTIWKASARLLQVAHAVVVPRAESFAVSWASVFLDTSTTWNAIPTAPQ